MTKRGVISRLKRAVVVIVWAIAFGFVEASVVEYLRAIYYPLSDGGFDFPIVTLSKLQSMGLEHIHRLEIEVAREFCTLVMLATVGIVAARNRREAWANFMIAFGVWDIFYYVWLKVLLDWPAGLMTWDLLFLLPVPWVSPVLAPVIISVALIVSGLIVLFFEDRAAPLVIKWRDWILISSGGIVVIVSFCWDYQNIIAGLFPQPFQWIIFSAGLGMSAITFLYVIFRRGIE